MEKIKLNIQMFADGETITYDTEKLAEFQTKINDVSNSINEMLTNFKATCEDLLEQNLSAEANSSLRSAISEIEKIIGNYTENVDGLGNFVGSIIEAFKASESQISSEISAWAETVKQAASAVYTTATTQAVQKGEYSAGQYTTDMINIAMSASQHTRALVGDAVNAIGATGKLINSVTGMTVVDAVKTGVQNTVSVLSSWLSGNKTSATALRLFNK